MTKLYDPFQQFRFDVRTCFLSGEPLSSDVSEVQVVPDWLMEAYGLRDQPIQMLDERITTYGQLKLPCTADVAERIKEMEEQIRIAFMDEGYLGAKALDPLLLFQWISKLVYGMVFNEIQAGVRQQALAGEPLNFSQVLVQKFRNLHSMLQSLVLPVEFEGHLPFSIHIFPLDNAADTFSYRDEINTLVFSLRMKDFGIVACLQDNGTNTVYHQEYLQAVKKQTLHPIQFEELCARFFYSAYLFNRLPEYTILPTPKKVYIESMSLGDIRMKPFFDPWQVKTFGQVLENFWRPWGYTLFEIIKDPENPMTYLLDASGNLLQKSAITLPVGGN